MINNSFWISFSWWSIIHLFLIDKFVILLCHSCKWNVCCNFIVPQLQMKCLFSQRELLKLWVKYCQIVPVRSHIILILVIDFHIWISYFQVLNTLLLYSLQCPGIFSHFNNWFCFLLVYNYLTIITIVFLVEILNVKTNLEDLTNDLNKVSD